MAPPGACIARAASQMLAIPRTRPTRKVPERPRLEQLRRHQSPEDREHSHRQRQVTDEGDVGNVGVPLGTFIVKVIVDWDARRA